MTIDVQPPAPSITQVEAQVQAFTKLYNSTVETIESQLTTKPPKGANEGGVGHAVRRPGTLQPADRDAPGDVRTDRRPARRNGEPSGRRPQHRRADGTSTSQASLEGLLSFSPAKLAESIDANPAGVSSMLEQWSARLQGILTNAAGPGGAIESRVTGDAHEVTQLGARITDMNEMLALREKALQETFTQMESLISESNAQGASLTKQSEALTAQKL